MKKQIIVRAESDLATRSDKVKKEVAKVNDLQKQVRMLVDSIEALDDSTYEAMDLSALYEEGLDALQSWHINSRLIGRNM